MSNLKKFNDVFMTSFDVQESLLSDLRYGQVPMWDSVGQMTLIANLEDEFDIMIDAEDIMDINSYESAKHILSTKYKIEF